MGSPSCPAHPGRGRHRPGGRRRKNLVLFGASIGRQCIEHGLVNERLIHLVPVLLGDGLRLFEEPGGEQVTLERLSLGMSGQLTDLRFRVVK